MGCIFFLSVVNTQILLYYYLCCVNVCVCEEHHNNIIFFKVSIKRKEKMEIIYSRSYVVWE